MLSKELWHVLIVAWTLTILILNFMQTHHHTAHITSYTIMTTSSQTHNLNSEEVSYLSLLLSIIASQNWQAFAHSILHNPAVFQSFCSNLHKSSDLNGMTILHAAVRHNPPLTIIKLLLKFTPDAPRVWTVWEGHRYILHQVRVLKSLRYNYYQVIIPPHA